MHSYEITGLKTCTVYDVELKGFTAAGVLRFTRETENTPKGTSSQPRKARLVTGSDTENLLYVYWEKPECDGIPDSALSLTRYDTRWKPSDGTSWMEFPITGRSELEKEYHGVLITVPGTAAENPSGASGASGGASAPALLPASSSRGSSDDESGEDSPIDHPPSIEGLQTIIYKQQDVELTASNSIGSSTSLTFSAEPTETAEPLPTKSGIWRPYDLPIGSTARINQTILEGKPLKVCTSVPGFVKHVDAAVKEWNKVIPGAFTFGNSASLPSSCGELSTNSNKDKTINNSSYDIAVMDYRSDCPAPTLQVLMGPEVQIDCYHTSCASTRRKASFAAHCHSSKSRCEAESPDAEGCASLKDMSIAGDSLPYKITGSLAYVLKGSSSSSLARIITHEIGHFLGLGDYGHGCYRLSAADTTASNMSYGMNASDVRDWQKKVATQDPAATECDSPTPTQRDKEDLHAIYHPAAFQSPKFVPEGSGDKWKLQFGLPPQDLRATLREHDTKYEYRYYNAYAYVVLYRTGTEAFQLLRNNAGKASLTTGDPIHLTPSQIEDPIVEDDEKGDNDEDDGNDKKNDTSNDWGVLVPFDADDDESDLVLKLNLTFDVGSNSALRGKEYAIAGLTRAHPAVWGGHGEPHQTFRLNLLDDDPALETWTVGDLAMVRIPPFSNAQPGAVTGQ